MGSFVPCEYGSFKVCDAIFTRLNTSDNMELNLSTFVLEMKDMSYIIDNMTDDSLVLVDELGRSTSPKDAMAISAAICEKLVKSKVRNIFKF